MSVSSLEALSNFVSSSSSVVGASQNKMVSYIAWMAVAQSLFLQTYRPGNQARSPQPTVWRLLVWVLPYANGIMRRRIIQWKYHAFQIVSKSGIHKVSRHSFVSLSCNAFLFEYISSTYFVLWQSAPYQRWRRVLQSSLYWPWTLWSFRHLQRREIRYTATKSLWYSVVIQFWWPVENHL